MTGNASPYSSDIVRFGGGAIIVILTLISLVAVGMTIGDVSHHFDVKRWPKVAGVVTKSRVNDVRGKNGAKGRLRFEPQVSFTYERDGETLKGNNARDVEPMSKADATSVVADYPVGGTIVVLYDPESPDKLTLDDDPPLVRGATFGFLLPSVLYWVYFGGWLIPAVIRGRRARRQAAANATLPP